MNQFPGIMNHFSGGIMNHFSGGMMNNFSAQGSLAMRSDGGNDDWKGSGLGDHTWIGSAGED